MPDVLLCIVIHTESIHRQKRNLPPPPLECLVHRWLYDAQMSERSVIVDGVSGAVAVSTRPQGGTSESCRLEERTDVR